MSLTPKQKQYIKQNYLKCPYREIAKRLGIKTEAVSYYVRKYLPLKSKVGKTGVFTYCETCKFAYGDLCFSVPWEQRTWCKTEIRQRKEGNNVTDTIRRVVNCAKYQKGRKPLSGRTFFSGTSRDSRYCIRL